MCFRSDIISIINIFFSVNVTLEVYRSNIGLVDIEDYSRGVKDKGWCS